jgi:hypothetical protein
VADDDGEGVQRFSLWKQCQFKHSQQRSVCLAKMVESFSQKCPVCSQMRKEDEEVICDECDADCGCKVGDCWAVNDKGSFCSECNSFRCESCGGIVICDECSEMYCEECVELKPGKGGMKRCHNCQPWWQKDEPATAFCKECGSRRQAAIICEMCGECVCSECPSFTCEKCGEESYCETCADLNFCEECELSTCDDCGCDCEEGETQFRKKRKKSNVR